MSHSYFVIPEVDISIPDGPLPASQADIAIPGDILSDDRDAMSGHGTYFRGDRLYASICGIVERTGKLVCVRSLTSRYVPETGHVVVGRVIQTQSDRWLLDINACQPAALLLSSINLLGGLRRRLGNDDRLQMRNYFVEKDLVVAEIQSVHSDGSVNVRLPKSSPGREGRGMAVRVPHILVRRLKTHYCLLPCGAHVVLGSNGTIWITHPGDAPDQQPGVRPMPQQQSPKPTTPKNQPLTRQQHELILRIANIVRKLASDFHLIDPTRINEMFLQTKDVPLYLIQYNLVGDRTNGGET